MMVRDPSGCGGAYLTRRVRRESPGRRMISTARLMFTARCGWDSRPHTTGSPAVA